MFAVTAFENGMPSGPQSLSTPKVRGSKESIVHEDSIELLVQTLDDDAFDPSEALEESTNFTLNSACDLKHQDSLDFKSVDLQEECGVDNGIWFMDHVLSPVLTPIPSEVRLFVFSL